MNSTFSLRLRFMTQGTLADPQGIPDPAFSFPATIHWMRALAILVDKHEVSGSAMARRFAAIKMASLSDQAVNTVYEQLLMSLHHVAALKAMGEAATKIDTVRSAIVTWYYAIYHAASAMITAQDGSHQDNHAETANAWDRQFAATPIAPEPFKFRVSTLVEADVEEEIDALRRGVKHNLDVLPNDAVEALGACMSYLKGSAAWRAAYIKEEVRRKDLKKIGLQDFRTARARRLRDERLQGKALGFMHQAFRYRGKANYREALFIGYGQNVEPRLPDYYSDLRRVGSAFLAMSGAYCARRIGKALWNSYFNDLSEQTRFGLKPDDLWQTL